MENASLILPRFACRINWDSESGFETTPGLVFDATNPIAVLNLADELSLKITFFKVSPIVSIYVKF